MLFIFVVLFSWHGQKRGQMQHQHCIISFARIREMLCPRSVKGTALSGGGKVSERQRLYVGGKTDSCLACWAARRRKFGLDLLRLKMTTYLKPDKSNSILPFYNWQIISMPYFGKTCMHMSCTWECIKHTPPCVGMLVCTLSEAETQFPACSLEGRCKST